MGVKKGASLAVLLIVFLVVGWYALGENNKKSSIIEGHAHSASVKAANSEFPNGYSLFVNKADLNTNIGMVIDAKGLGDTFPYNIKFVNNSGRNSTFALALYIDYQQKEFRIDREDQSTLVHTFPAANGELVNIPVRFSMNDLSAGSHSFFVSVVAGADKHASTLGESSDAYGVYGRYTLRIGGQEAVPVQPERDIPLDVMTGNSFSGILVNQDETNSGKIYVPSTQINAKPGGPFELTIHAGGLEGVTEYMAFVTVGFKQVPLAKDQSYWDFQVPQGGLARKRMSFKAPDKPGDYEVIAYLTSNPWKVLDDGFVQDTMTLTSYRFTLHVE
jgi:hypothetical protein